MFTTCTNCKTRFKLTAAQLTAAQGQVRCGKCHEVFDAYAALEGAELAPQMPAPAEPDISSAGPSDISDVPMQIHDDAAPEPEMPMAVEDEPITSAPALKAGSRKPPPIDDLFSTLTEEEPEPLPLPEPLGSRRQPRIPLQDPGAGLPTEQGAEREDSFAARTPEPSPMYADEVGSPASFAHVEDLHAPPAPPPRRPLVSAAWWLGVLILALVLGVQLVDMDRVALSQNPVIGPSLQALYGALGRPLSGAGAASAWDVSALNVTTDPDSNGALSITGSLTNGSGLAQPWPYLRVVLTDRFGTALRSRDFKPADYLPAGQSAVALAPGLAARFRLDVVDPGADAVGFSLTPCLDVTAGRICAQPNSAD